MLEIIIDWMANQWLEIASLGIATTALVYAALAYHSSQNVAQAAQATDLVNLRLQAKSALAEAERSFLTLKSSCNSVQEDWKTYSRKHCPKLGQDLSNELSSISQLQNEGSRMLQDIRHQLDSVDAMNAFQLETRFQKAKAAALEIESLMFRLERPPTYFN